MNGRVLLDTNIVIAYLNNDASVRRHLKGVVSFISVITASELLYGALNSADAANNVRRERDFLSVQAVLSCNLVTAERCSLLRLENKQRGIGLDESDLWIAAHAIQYGLTLVTRDNDFDSVPGLSVETW